MSAVEMHRFSDDPILTAGFEYWLNLPREAGVPDRREVDPSQMPRSIISNVALLEIIDDCTDARFRLAGQQFDDNFGFSLKGKKTSELTEGEYRDYMLGHVQALVDCRQPIYSESAFRWDQGGHLRTRRIMMPMSHGQPDVIAMILKIQTWPREQMRGLPFCEAIAGAKPLCNSAPQVVRSKDG
jgi:hypothetical protein